MQASGTPFAMGMLLIEEIKDVGVYCRLQYRLPARLPNLLHCRVIAIHDSEKAYGRFVQATQAEADSTPRFRLAADEDIGQFFRLWRDTDFSLSDWMTWIAAQSDLDSRELERLQRLHAAFVKEPVR